MCMSIYVSSMVLLLSFVYISLIDFINTVMMRPWSMSFLRLCLQQKQDEILASFYS